MDGSKDFPDRTRLTRFVRMVTGKTGRATNELLEQVVGGVGAALHSAADYGKQHSDAAHFLERLSAVLQQGLARLKE